MKPIKSQHILPYVLGAAAIGGIVAVVLATTGMAMATIAPVHRHDLPHQCPRRFSQVSRKSSRA